MTSSIGQSYLWFKAPANSSKHAKNIYFVFEIQKSKVVNGLTRIKPGKAFGPDGFSVEVWKSLCNIGVLWLTKLFNKTILT